MQRAREGGPKHPVLSKHNRPVIWQQASLQAEHGFWYRTWVSNWQTTAKFLTINLPDRFTVIQKTFLVSVHKDNLHLPHLYCEFNAESQFTKRQQYHGRRENSTGKQSTLLPPYQGNSVKKGVKKYYEKLCLKYCENGGAGLQFQMQVCTTKSVKV